MAYIYKITNDINGKMYVGKTYKAIEKRLQEHIRDSRRRKMEKRPLYAAINKYGAEHFHVELIEETDIPEKRESYWIEKLRTYVGFKDCNGYNATLGGDGKPYIDYDLVVKTYNELKFISKTVEKLGIDQETVRKILKERNVTIIKNVPNAKKVDQYTLSGDLINSFDSASNAARKMIEDGKSTRSVKSVGRIITNCCNKNIKTAYGYIWKFA